LVFGFWFLVFGFRLILLEIIIVIIINDLVECSASLLLTLRVKKKHSVAEYMPALSVLFCPHFKGGILIEKKCCGIFRDGMFMDTKKQLNPHASKAVCEAAVASGRLLGCGKPFKITEHGKPLHVCEYL
jgi:hypothetical protein